MGRPVVTSQVYEGLIWVCEPIGNVHCYSYNGSSNNGMRPRGNLAMVVVPNT